MDIHVRKLTKDDADAFWQLRLKGLRSSPEAFGSSYEDAVKLPPEEIQRRLGITPDNYVCGAFSDEDRLVGIVGFRRESAPKLRHKGMVWGMYVAEEARGQGVARRLLSRLLEHAAALDGLEQAMLMVVTTNEPAVRLYESLGFARYGTEPNALHVDGRAYDEHLMVFRFPREQA
ncbi:N-acetyltransferase [Paenibacillus sp. J31TS4]|uniref:GNAT family N-acetyltransferase n=1 Tax=Paenibacillus sp. J31TS4 TaxID=2807195 RepID=UPI001B2C909B|nr:GNAT family N-acetyltransferase [Paenibacillus sp. J31TS4]GIP38969.1 N-acetyltransferase [Paenibacillus sp. J31TS4]